MQIESIIYGFTCIAFVVLGLLFLFSWRANVRGGKEIEEAAKFLEKYTEMENPTKAAARLLRMKEEDVALEISKGRVLNLVGQKIASTAATLKSPISLRW